MAWRRCWLIRSIRDPLRTYRLPDCNGRTHPGIYNKSDKPACLRLLAADLAGYLADSRFRRRCRIDAGEILPVFQAGIP